MDLIYPLFSLANYILQIIRGTVVQDLYCAESSNAKHGFQSFVRSNMDVLQLRTPCFLYMSNQPQYSSI